MAVTKPKINQLLTKINYSDASRTKKEIRYLVKHYVGAAGGAEANCRYFQSAYRGASAHYFVGHNGEIWQSVKDEDIAWHCGASKYKHKECRNSNSIGVELCVLKDSRGKWYYTDETKRAAEQLFAYLMEKYQIDLSHVLRHYDVTGKTCGEPDVRSGNKVWSSFRSGITSLLEQSEKQEEKESSQPAAASETVNYMVKVSKLPLNIYKGAGTAYGVAGTIKQEGTYTIVKETGGWGKLKSGAGWVWLADVKRVA